MSAESNRPGPGALAVFLRPEESVALLKATRRLSRSKARQYRLADDADEARHLMAAVDLIRNTLVQAGFGSLTEGGRP